MLSVVFTTFATEDTAKVFAKKLLANQLAVCVQLESITSFYNWQGHCMEEPEIRMIIKFKKAQMPQLAIFFADNHPYDVPQLVEIEANSVAENYLNWAMES